MMANGSNFSIAVPERFSGDGCRAEVSTNRTESGAPCADGQVQKSGVSSGFAAESHRHIHTFVSATRRIREGELLYREGAPFRFIYAIRTGTFKSVVLSLSGAEQVTGFHFAGDLLGVDGLGRGVHGSAATALEDGEIGLIPYASLTAATEGNFELQQLVGRVMSREIVREQNLVMLLATMSADARLAAFLLHLSRQMGTRGYSPAEFHLRMSRVEIASHLGVTVETVSRTFTAFEQRRLILVNRKHVQILDFSALQRALDSRPF